MRTLTLVAVLLVSAAAVPAAELPANTDREFHAALAAAKPGDTIRLGAGPFGGGFFATTLAGTKDNPIRITGPSKEKPAVFTAPKTGVIQVVRASYVEIENLHITRSLGHGLAIDDGGKNDFSCHHVTVRDVRIDDVGPNPSVCSIKMAGVADFTIAGCAFGTFGPGLAVDGVGCRGGVVENCTFGPNKGGVAVQFKGGSESVAIRGCVFDDAGSRAINVGGMTGEPFFRPKPRGFEARDVTVERNVFVGTDAPVAFANADGAVVRFNTIYLPRQWAFRILQENSREDFTPCRNGKIEDNVIVFSGKGWLEGGINVGPKTAPGTFTFARNAWYCQDAPARSAPRLPTKEVDSVVGKDPGFVDPAKRDFSLRPESPAKGKGHTAAPHRDGVGA